MNNSQQLGRLCQTADGITLGAITKTTRKGFPVAHQLITQFVQGTFTVENLLQ